MSWYNSDGYLQSRKDELGAQNGVMFSVMDYKLSYNGSVPQKANLFYLVKQFIEYAYRDRVDQYKLSLDNMNGVTLAYKLDVINYKSFKECRAKTSWDQRLRPDNFITWYHMEWYLIPITIFMMIFAIPMILWSCFDLYDDQPRGEGEDRIYIEELATSGKLQVWIRLHCMRWLPIKRICTWLLPARYGNWKGVFDTYFPKGHPLKQYLPFQYELV